MARLTKDVRRDYLRPEKYLSIDEVQKLRRFVKNEAERARKRGSTRALINEMIIEIMLETGVRSEELCQLRLSDLPTHHGKNAILVRKKKGQEPRVVLVKADLREKLKVYIKRCRSGAKPGSPLFASEKGFRLLRTIVTRNKETTIVKERTGRISYMSLYRRIKCIGRKAGIPNLTPHTLRHTFGSHLYSIERDIAVVGKQLGHKSLSSTQVRKMKSDLLSVPEIAQRLGVPNHKVQYLVMARRIDPVRRVGSCRLFEADVVERLRCEINGKETLAKTV